MCVSNGFDAKDMCPLSIAREPPLVTRLWFLLFWQVRLKIFQDGTSHGERLGVAAAATLIIIRLNVHPSLIKPGMNLDELIIVNFLSGLEVQLASENSLRLLGIVKWDSVFAADQGPVLINGARAIIESGARKPQTGRR